MVSIERHNNSCIVMCIEMFANYVKMPNLKGTVRSLVARFRSDLSSLISLGLHLFKGGSGTDEEGNGSLEGPSCWLVGFSVSYCLRYDFSIEYSQLKLDLPS